jgi:UPF0716 protein FxsA
VSRIVPLLFLAAPLAEIATFILVGQLIGLGPTLLGVVVSAVLGVLLMRSLGQSTLATLRRVAGERRFAGREIADTVLLGFAAALLIVPGYLSDIVAILLLIPPVRALLLGLVGARVVVATSATVERPEQPRIVDLTDDHWRPR